MQSRSIGSSCGYLPASHITQTPHTARVFFNHWLINRFRPGVGQRPTLGYLWAPHVSTGFTANASTRRRLIGVLPCGHPGS